LKCAAQSKVGDIFNNSTKPGDNKMIRKNHTVKINLSGGIVAAGDLHTIMCAAENARVENIQLGVRQQLYCIVADKFAEQFLSVLKSANIIYEVNKEEYPNIVSSYVTEEVFQNGNWLSEGVYKDILDLFDYSPRLKINIIDNNQTFVPFFTGNINFISADTNNYWHLYIRFPKTNITYRWPGLIYSADIPRISKLIEETILAEKHLYYDQQNINADILHTVVQEKGNFISQPISNELQMPAFVLPYYEGFNKYGNKIWLGIYRRDEMFPVSFLKDICSICLQTKVGQLHATPWKSFIVKGIQQHERKLWDYVLGKHRINVRHASNELNWQVEDLCDEGLILKRYLIRQFDKEDVRTFGLCFAIKTQLKTGSFGSVVIRRQVLENRNKHYVLDRYKYDILYTNNFNPNSKEYILFRTDIKKEELAVYLVSLCKYFYESQSDEDFVSHATYRQSAEKPEVLAPAEIIVHQCKYCFTIYDEMYGDTINAIEAGVNFDTLDNSYTCPTCGAAKDAFAAITKPSSIVA
jgi:rubredoxin